MQTYWDQVFLLPKKIIQIVTHTCRMTRGCDNSTKALVAWDTMCMPKTVGGLNIIEFGRWNRATIRKLLWALSHKKNTLWVQCIHIFFYIKARNLEDMESLSKHVDLSERCSMQDSGSPILTLLYTRINFLLWDHSVPRNCYLSLIPQHPIVAWKSLLLATGPLPRH